MTLVSPATRRRQVVLARALSARSSLYFPHPPSLSSLITRLYFDLAYGSNKERRLDVPPQDLLDEDNRLYLPFLLLASTLLQSILITSVASHSLILLAQIKAHSNLSPPPSHSYSILLVPRATELCRCILEEEGVLGDVVLKSYELGFLPVEPDVLSLELDGSARDIFLVTLISLSPSLPVFLLWSRRGC
jgi:hypothetical protein